jgi:ketosteroid isomerase-like protein
MRRLLSNSFSLALAGVFLLRPAPSRADEEADRAELRKLRALYEEVVKSDDLTKLMPYLPPRFTAVTPTGEQVKGPNELQEYFKKIWGMIGRGGTYQVKVNLGSTDLYNDIAVSYGTTDEFIKTAEGTEYQFPMLWTAVSRKQNGAWKVIRMHGSIDPLTNVFVTTQLNALKWIYGVGGLTVGLIVGILTRFIRFRRS